MTLEEAKAHFTTLAQSANLTKEETETVLKAMENDKFRTGLASGYKRQEDYSRAMDAVTAEKARLTKWHQEEEMPKYRAYQAGLAELDKYKTTFGEIDEDGQGLNNGGGGNGNGNGTKRNGASMTKEDFEKAMEDKLRQRDAAYVHLTKTAIKISSEHSRRFGEDLDTDAVEKLALERGMDLEAAYRVYVAPKEQVLVEAQHKKEIETAKAEAIRDYQSRNHIPADTRPRENHPFFDRKAASESGKPVSDLEAERDSQDAFLKGWNEYSEEQTKQPA